MIPLLILGLLFDPAVESDDLHIDFHCFAGRFQRFFDDGCGSAATGYFHSSHCDRPYLVETENFREFFHIFIRCVIQLRTENNQDSAVEKLPVKTSERMRNAVCRDQQIGSFEIFRRRIQQLQLYRPLPQRRR